MLLLNDCFKVIFAVIFWSFTFIFLFKHFKTEIHIFYGFAIAIKKTFQCIVRHKTSVVCEFYIHVRAVVVVVVRNECETNYRQRRYSCCRNVQKKTKKKRTKHISTQIISQSDKKRITHKMTEVRIDL